LLFFRGEKDEPGKKTLFENRRINTGCLYTFLSILKSVFSTPPPDEEYSKKKRSPISKTVFVLYMDIRPGESDVEKTLFEIEKNM
jgi:hypothetical protein